MAKPKCNNKRFTKDDLIRFLREAVMFSPIPKGLKKDTYCKRFASFVMLYNPKDLKLESFGVDVFKSSRKELFFQRGKRQFPALIINELDGFDTIKNGDKKECINLQIGVLDKLIEDCGSGCGYCGSREEWEISCDVKELINQVWAYLHTICMACGFKYIKNEEGVIIEKKYVSDEFGWVSKAVIDQLIADGKIDGVDINYPLTNKLNKMIVSLNSRYKVERWFYPRNYYGKWFNFTFCQNLECPDYEWNVKEYSKNIDVSCC